MLTRRVALQCPVLLQRLGTGARTKRRRILLLCQLSYSTATDSAAVPPGLEPGTSRLTVEVTRTFASPQSEWEESNLRHVVPNHGCSLYTTSGWKCHGIVKEQVKWHAEITRRRIQANEKRSVVTRALPALPRDLLRSLRPIQARQRRWPGTRQHRPHEAFVVEPDVVHAHNDERPPSPGQAI